MHGMLFCLQKVTDISLPCFRDSAGSSPRRQFQASGIQVQAAIFPAQSLLNFSSF